MTKVRDRQSSHRLAGSIRMPFFRSMVPATIIIWIGVFVLTSGCSTTRPHMGPVLSSPVCPPSIITAAEPKDFLRLTRGQVLPAELKSGSVSDGFALLVGVATTNVSIEGFERLRFPEQEVEGMYRCLSASGYRVKPLLNETATRDNILKWLNFFSNLGGRNRLLFYYTGHGTIYGKQIVHLNGTRVTGIYPHLEPTAWADIENRLVDAIYSPLDSRPPPAPLPRTVNDRIDRSFFLLPYQPAKGADSGPFHKFYQVVGYDEIAAIFARSTATEKVIIIDACSAGLPKPPIFNPLPSYVYDIQRQGFVFFTLISPDEGIKIPENQFTPVIEPGLWGEADLEGDRNGIVTAFELIRHGNVRWRHRVGAYGMRPNQMNHMIFGSADIPITMTNKGRGR